MKQLSLEVVDNNKSLVLRIMRTGREKLIMIISLRSWHLPDSQRCFSAGAAFFALHGSDLEFVGVAVMLADNLFNFASKRLFLFL